jgi:dienelactone hydrolase
MAALTMARASARLTAVVSVHGSLHTSQPARPGAVTAPVLVCHGADDPHVPMADVLAFGEEMTSADADWQVNIYGGAQHGFTHRDAVEGVTPGVAYNEYADLRSFAAVDAFLTEAFQRASA